MEWYLKAAHQGHAQSQHNIGALYCHGQGVPQDDSQATEWFLRAAKQGLVISQATIGYCYSNDLGVPQDYAKAAEWYQKAADQGHIEAKTALEDMRKSGRIID
ncbi:hypothetical protein BGZ90_003700 [Linnemannia elongata]|nr:hypothetical protein BGZ90_003700 [Linnemannia elongata]